MADLSREEARRFFDYADGCLIWRVRPREDFLTDVAWRAWNNKFPGARAGSPDTRGYWSVRITIKGRARGYLVHRVIWSWHNGPAPDEVDHRNNDNGNNAIGNLRAATGSQNKSNRRRFQRGACPFNGVSFDRGRRRWKAGIRINGKSVTLGYFRCPTMAALKYDGAAAAQYGEFAKLNFEVTARAAKSGRQGHEHGCNQ